MTAAQAPVGSPTILDWMDHPDIWGSWFRDPVTWRAWRVFLAALFGLPVSRKDRALYRECTGRAAPSKSGFLAAWLVVGRRGGKSLILALIAVFLAFSQDWSPFLAPGERGTIMVIATDRKQARVIYRYAHALISEVPVLARFIERVTEETIDLSNRVTIEISSASFRRVRGYTLIAALLDELAFWRSEESANPDEEIIAALRPAMATIPGAMLLSGSSPYARRGALWNAFRRHFGKNDAPELVWKAATRTMNPSVPQSVIDEAIERDPANAAAEFGGEFRTDIEGFVSREIVEALVEPGRFELPRIHGVAYSGFVDPAGGSGQDAYTLAIAHQDQKTKAVVVDLLRERRPHFSPEQVTTEFADQLKAYGCTKVMGDRWGGEFPREIFRKHGIAYEISEKPKSDLYRELLPILNAGQIELLDHPRLIAQLCGLERRTARGGRDSIDHAPLAHDDICNAVAGVAVLVNFRQQPMRFSQAGLAMI
ncbi:MAG TPA: terminase large subunit [Stellaceae bacterium]|nr:terminase large subunit [Stellaceae bacterium]